MPSRASPSDEQIASLEAYAREHGRYWKSALRTDWINARCNPALQQLRNSFGPTWLANYRLPAPFRRIRPPR